MNRPHSSQKFPTVVQDTLQAVQLGVVAATTDLHYIQTSHREQLDGQQLKMLNRWHKQLADLGREIGDILGG